MTNELRVAVNVGSRFHQVVVGDASGRLVDEFRVDHRRTGFELFFERIARRGASDVRLAMEGYNGLACPRSFPDVAPPRVAVGSRARD